MDQNARRTSLNQDKINDILKVIIAYARLDFTPQVILSEKGDEIDALGAGVNMLGEELNASVISLREKEVMLREIHHRVKNNLQIISSLLSLQVERETNERVRHYARESQNRIRAISLIHEMLYKTSDFKYTNLRNYVDNLCHMLSSTYAMPGSNIHIKNNIPNSVFFDVDRMIPLGLILNEGISNSIKHAFTNHDGVIEVGYHENNATTKELIISDNGKGLKDRFDLEHDGNLGMQLMYLLAEQLKGKLSMTNHQGVHYTLNF